VAERAAGAMPQLPPRTAPREDTPQRMWALCQSTAPETWPGDTRDRRLPWRAAPGRPSQARQVDGAALSHCPTATPETPGGQADPASAYALAHRAARGMAEKWCDRALPVLGGPSHQGPARGLPGTSTPLRVWHLTTAQSAPSHALAAEVPTRHPVASGTPHDASVSRATLVRHAPRQEPGVVVPHAGICVGGAG
jgi:hypothetical protein